MGGRHFDEFMRLIYHVGGHVLTKVDVAVCSTDFCNGSRRLSSNLFLIVFLFGSLYYFRWLSNTIYSVTWENWFKFISVDIFNFYKIKNSNCSNSHFEFFNNIKLSKNLYFDYLQHRERLLTYACIVYEQSKHFISKVHRLAVYKRFLYHWGTTRSIFFVTRVPGFRNWNKISLYIG